MSDDLEPSLFPYLTSDEPAKPDPTLSAGRRLTLRQRADVERGVHPLTRGPVLMDGETCGSCIHRVVVGRGNGSFPKCDLSTMARSAASDVRAWWPACPRWEPSR